MDTYDVAIIGAGPGGEAAARRANLRGAKTCLIEANKLGGTCLNVGCIPTKAMLHASELFWEINRADRLGISVGDLKLDPRAYMKRVSEVPAGIVKALDRRYETGEVRLLRGRGALTGPNTIEVKLNDGGTEQVQAKSIIIATGSVPLRPSIFPWESPRVMATDEAVTSETLPDSVIVVGGGVIGCEFATVYSELGILTTLIEMLERLCDPLDQDASKLVHRSLRGRKVNVLLRSEIVEMTADEGSVTAKTRDGRTVEAACALVAVGRKRNTENIGLETAGVQVTEGLITVDDRCRTNIPHIYAVGDVAETRQYAHLATRMGEVAADNAAGLETADDRSCVPIGVYTHPEAAAVGLSEAEANAQNPNAHSAAIEYRATGAAWAYDQTEGMVKITADGQNGKILGAIVVGYHATAVVEELAVAMKNGLSVAQLAETIHPHPTFAEGVLLAAQKWLAETEKAMK